MMWKTPGITLILGKNSLNTPANFMITLKKDKKRFKLDYKLINLDKGNIQIGRNIILNKKIDIVGVI